MKSFDELYGELVRKTSYGDEDSGTVRLLAGGVHAVGKKVLEEAAEAWMAAEHESRERAAEEISQLLYQVQALMLAIGITPDDVYETL